jgi:DNA invertase Pin-like site-specific DNA recombinase
MNKAYSYIRFSSAQQRHGRSQDRQREDCEKYCRQHELSLATGEDYTFLDPGLSGYHGDHVGPKGQLRRFISLVEDGTIEPGSSLIVESLDRLGRQDVNTALSLFLHLIGSGIRIVTLTDNKVYTNKGESMDLIISILIMSRANEESSTKARRVRDAMRDKHRKARESNEPMGKAIPLWLELTEQREFRVRDDQAGVVRRIFQMATEGYGKAATARVLNDEGIPSFKGKTWGASSVDKILNNKAVLGFYQPYSVQVAAEGKRLPSGNAIAGYYPAIVDESTFYQAQAAINGRRISGATRQSDKFNVWTKVAKCVHCGTAMHLVNKGKPPKGGTYLHCYKARKGLCTGKMVRLDHSEEVFKFMLAQLDSLSLVQDSSGKISKELAEVEGRLHEQRVTLEEFKAALRVRRTVTVLELVDETEDEIKGLSIRREELLASLAVEKIGSYQDFLSKLDLVSKPGRSRANTLLQRLKVVVYIGSAYLITEKDHAVSVLAYKDGKVGSLGLDNAGTYTGGGEVVMRQLVEQMERGTSFVSKWQMRA